MTDRDLSTSWASAADSTAETRLYYGQNWSADTSVVVSSSGAILRWSKYTASGKRDLPPETSATNDESPVGRRLRLGDSGP